MRWTSFLLLTNPRIPMKVQFGDSIYTHTAGYQACGAFAVSLNTYDYVSFKHIKRESLPPTIVSGVMTDDV